MFDRLLGLADHDRHKGAQPSLQEALSALDAHEANRKQFLEEATSALATVEKQLPPSLEGETLLNLRSINLYETPPRDLCGDLGDVLREMPRLNLSASASRNSETVMSGSFARISRIERCISSSTGGKTRRCILYPQL